MFAEKKLKTREPRIFDSSSMKGQEISSIWPRFNFMIYTEVVKITVERSNGKAVLIARLSSGKTATC